MEISDLLIGVACLLLSGVIWYFSYKAKISAKDGIDRSNAIQLNTAAIGFAFVGLYFLFKNI
jgi:hypothetical protein